MSAATHPSCRQSTLPALPAGRHNMGYPMPTTTPAEGQAIKDAGFEARRRAALTSYRFHDGRRCVWEITGNAQTLVSVELLVELLEDLDYLRGLRQARYDDLVRKLLKEGCFAQDSIHGWYVDQGVCFPADFTDEQRELLREVLGHG